MQDGYKKLKAVLIVTLSALLLFSCQSNKSLVGGYLDLDTDISIHFVVDADSNPDEAGLGSPLFVRLYELQASKLMQRADFIDLYEKDLETLGSDVVGDVFRFKPFVPGESRSEHFVLDKKTQYFALYAEFLDFEQSKFKLIIPVVVNNVFRNSYTVRISGNEILLASTVSN